MMISKFGISKLPGVDFQVNHVKLRGVYVRCQKPMGKSGHKNPPRPWRELGLMDGMTHRWMVPWLWPGAGSHPSRTTWGYGVAMVDLFRFYGRFMARKEFDEEKIGHKFPPDEITALMSVGEKVGRFWMILGGRWARLRSRFFPNNYQMKYCHCKCLLQIQLLVGAYAFVAFRVWINYSNNFFLWRRAPDVSTIEVFRVDLTWHHRHVDRIAVLYGTWAESRTEWAYFCKVVSTHIVSKLDVLLLRTFDQCKT